MEIKVKIRGSIHAEKKTVQYSLYHLYTICWCTYEYIAYDLDIMQTTSHILGKTHT